MNPHTVKILEEGYVTHDVRHIITEKPDGFSFIPGQAADVSINLPEWKDKVHPFTFTCLNDWDYLEFMIKTYPERKGVTNKLRDLKKDDELIIHDVFGSIHYAGPGVFIAGGAGVTPFIAILRDVHERNELDGNKLIFSNKTPKDVIMEDELDNMLGKDFIKVFTDEGPVITKINRDYLSGTIKDFNQHFYLCGPDAMVKALTSTLMGLGASNEKIIIEK